MGCERTARQETGTPEYRVVREADLREAIASVPAKYALLVDPRDCFSCFPVLDSVRRSHAAGMSGPPIVLSRQPTPTEARYLVLAGVKAIGVAAPGTDWGGRLTPPLSVSVNSGALVASPLAPHKSGGATAK